MNIQYFSEDIIMNFSMIIFFFVFVMLITIFIIYIISLFKKPKLNGFQPNLCVIIPTYNEQNTIKKCLDAIYASDYDSKIEIICVDDGSTDATLKIIKKYAGKHTNLRYIECKHKGKSNALNQGVKKSKFDYIVTIDSDTYADRNFLKEIAKPFSNPKVGATNAIALIHKPKNMAEHFQSVEYLFNNLIRNSFSKIFNNGIWFFGASACFNKKVLKKVGCFKSDVLTEDMDISLRIFEQGYDVITVETAITFTKACSSFLELFNQRMRWFFGGLQCSFRYKKLFWSKSFAIKYLFIEKYFWAFFALIVFPILFYQVNYWMPRGIFNILSYIFRWFSLFGPLYVLYKIPEWGLSLVNIFGVTSGIITTIMMLSSFYYFKNRVDLYKIIVIVFYFPYTLFLNLALSISILKYLVTKEKYFLR